MPRDLPSRRFRAPSPGSIARGGAHCAALALALCASAPRVAAQSRTFTACTPGALEVCTEFRLTTGPSVFEIALRSLGATGAPALPVSVYNLVFATGAAGVGTPATTDVTPTAEGGAVVSDASAWEAFDTGGLVFLSALTNRGVGGCAAGADAGGFGQAVLTCGAGQFALFRFAPTAVFDPQRFVILNLEAVALTNPTQGASCGAPGAACRLVGSVIPEPGTLALAAGGFAVLVGWRARRRAL